MNASNATLVPKPNVSVATRAADSLPNRSPMSPTSATGSAPKRHASQRARQFLEPMSPQGLMLAFQRRWRTAVLFAVPAAVIAAALVWLAVPAPFTAFALLRVEAVEQRLVFQTAETNADFATYRRTQMALLKSRFVINAALRKPNIAALAMVRKQQFPVQWLEDSLVVDAYDSPEILRVSLTGDDPNELAAIVNAVKDAYLEEVVNAERKQRIARLNDLERIFEQTEDKVRLKEKRVNDLAQELGTGDTQALTIKQQMAMEYFAQLRREHARVRFALMQEQVGDQAATIVDDATLTAPGDASPTKSPAPTSKSSSPTPKVPEKPASGALVTPPRSLATVATLDIESQAKASDAGTGSDAAAGDDSDLGVAQRRIKQLKDLISRFEKQVVNKNHPTLLAFRKELEELQTLAVSEGTEVATPGQPKRRTRLDLLKRQEQLLREELDKYSALVKNIGTSSFELESMKADIEQVAKVSNKVGTEMETLRIELQSPTRISLLQEAEVPQTRSMSKKKNLTSAAGVGGLGLVFLIFSVMEFHTRRITDPKDLVQTMGLELLGTLPAMPKPLLRMGGPAASRTAMWNNALIESVDSIRSILLHSDDAERRQILMIASATAGEGKTTFACQLAGSLARSGRKTLLVDCDLRRPRVHELLQVSNGLGMSELLTENLRPETVLQATDDPNLFVIAAGQVNETALQEVARNGAASLFTEMRKEFEFIIVDSSPLLCVADSSSIARNVDAAILVARQDVSRVPLIAVACERMDMLGLPLHGSVMVGVKSNLSGYGYSYDYHYATSGGAA
ncbi:MAG: polysaccharide biosynthesis tyrosine autokinase [Planctomycetaceae bacterium]